MNEVHRNVVLREDAVITNQRVAMRLRIILPSLRAAHELSERVVHDGDMGGHRMRAQQQLLVRVHEVRDPTRRDGSVRGRPIQIDQAVPSRFIARRHRIVRVDIDRARPRRDRRPDPHALIGSGDGIAVEQRDGPIAAL